MDDKVLNNKIALVTGAGSGIGSAISLKLSKMGANVMVTDINERGMEETIKLIKNNNGFAESYKMDVTNKKMIDDTVNKIIDKHGSIDILINNAGISTPPVFGSEMPDEDWDKLLKVHLYGAFYCVRSCGKVMKKNEYGRIVMISPLAGFTGLTGNMNYAVAKTGLVGMTYSLAKELGPFGITINAVQPGIIRTPFTEKPLKVMEEEFVKETPVSRIGNPEDVANAVSFFCKPKSDFINGSVIRVDGGYALQTGMDRMMYKICTGE